MPTLAKLTKIRAYWHRIRGDNKSAHDLYLKVVEAYENSPEADSLAMAEALTLLGKTALRLQSFREALDALKRALEIRSKHFDPEDWSVSDLHDLIGSIHFFSLYDSESALHHFEAAFRIREKLLPDHPATAQSALRLAQVYQVLGRYADSYSLQEVSTRILSRTRESSHPEAIASAIDLASNYLALGHHDLAQSTALQALETIDKTQGFTNRDALIVLLTTLATIQNHKSDYRSAIRYCRRALEVCKEIKADKLQESLVFNAMAFAHVGIADYDHALSLAHQALTVQESQLGRDHLLVGSTLTTLSHGYQSIGRIDKSFPLLQEVIRIDEQRRGPGHPVTAIGIENLAKAYLSLGDYSKALEQFHKALEILLHSLGEQHPLTLTCIINLATAYCSINDFGSAAKLCERVLATIDTRLGPEHHSTAVVLDIYAQVLNGQNRFKDSLPLFQRSLAIREKTMGPNHPAFAISLLNMASAYQGNGDLDSALPMVERAQSVLTESIGLKHPTTIECSTRLATLYYAKGMPLLGICQLKYSINAQQEQRSLVSTIGRNELATYTHKVESSYQLLASWLATEGRLPEVLQVLDLLAESEYFDFIRRSIEDDPRSSRVAYNPLENNWVRQFEEVTNRLADIGMALQQIDLKHISTRTPLDLKKQNELTAALSQARTDYSSFLAKMRSAYDELASRERQPIPQSTLENLQQIQVTINALGANVALMQYFVRDDRLGVLLTTAGQQYEFQFQKPRDLAFKIVSFWQGLANRRSEVYVQAKELYDLVIAPVANTLNDIGAKTIMLLPGGELHLLPFCALHDGEHFLIERWNFPIFSPLTKYSLCDKPAPEWTAAGLGVSRRIGDHSALPAVPEELRAVVQHNGHGVLPGVMYLDEEFTSGHLRAATGGQFNVVHVASHFQFMRGTEEDSYLLLGDGTRLTLAQMRSEYWNFSNLDLLTLSACETGLGGDLNRQSGKAIDGLGVTVQRKGAKSVIATLWRIEDSSTAIFMHEFYAVRQSKHLVKSEALRQAQLSLLHGSFTAGQATSDDGIESDVLNSKCHSKAAGAYAHPFYWAPFILMGNWQ